MNNHKISANQSKMSEFIIYVGIRCASTDNITNSEAVLSISFKMGQNVPAPTISQFQTQM